MIAKISMSLFGLILFLSPLSQAKNCLREDGFAICVGDQFAQKDPKHGTCEVIGFHRVSPYFSADYDTVHALCSGWTFDEPMSSGAFDYLNQGCLTLENKSEQVCAGQEFTTTFGITVKILGINRHSKQTHPDSFNNVITEDAQFTRRVLNANSLIINK